MEMGSVSSSCMEGAGNQEAISASSPSAKAATATLNWSAVAHAFSFEDDLDVSSILGPDWNKYSPLAELVHKSIALEGNFDLNESHACLPAMPSSSASSKGSKRDTAEPLESESAKIALALVRYVMNANDSSDLGLVMPAKSSFIAASQAAAADRPASGLASQSSVAAHARRSAQSAFQSSLEHVLVECEAALWCITIVMDSIALRNTPK